MFIGLLSFSGPSASIVNTAHHIKCISLNSQQWVTQPTLINLYPNE